MIKVVLTGVECTGKTALAQSIAGHFHAALTEEFAREFLIQKSGKYIREDLLTILQGQFDLEAKEFINGPDLLVCDTGPLVIKVWSLFKYGIVDPKIEVALKSYRPDLYILPDLEGVPFIDDPLRENPNDRVELYNIYLQELRELDIPYLIVSGSFENRLNQAINAINSLLN